MTDKLPERVEWQSPHENETSPDEQSLFNILKSIKHEAKWLLCLGVLQLWVSQFERYFVLQGLINKPKIMAVVDEIWTLENCLLAWTALVILNIIRQTNNAMKRVEQEGWHLE